MLDVNPETVCRLIDLAHAFHAQEQVALNEEPDHLDEDWAAEALAEHSGNAVLEEFRTIITDLEPDQQQQIVALLWLGRGDYMLEDWSETLEQAGYDWNENTADYLIAHPLLADHLSEGLNQHGYNCE